MTEEGFLTDLNKTLGERGKTHGDYTDMSEVIQRLKNLARSVPGWNVLNDVQRETLDSIFLKTGRILTGDPNFPEHWHDIAGYATRMEQALTKISWNSPMELVSVFARYKLTDYKIAAVPRSQFYLTESEARGGVPMMATFNEKGELVFSSKVGTGYEIFYETQLRGRPDTRRVVHWEANNV